ncbi:MAG: hypothetical protein NTX24_02315 [Candidatus Pacearchaeota archaeon]|nr:hypothetical protein [Candidatus Pacearchaeota archaeon]
MGYRHKRHRHKPSKEAEKTRYYARAIKRIVVLLIWLFVLFVIVMGIIWGIPKIWHFVFP